MRPYLCRKLSVMAGIKEINTETLREWLENGQPVSVLDIRPISERADWYIPGSIHINAYQNLKEHDPEVINTVPDNPFFQHRTQSGNHIPAAGRQTKLRESGIRIGWRFKPVHTERVKPKKKSVEF